MTIKPAGEILASESRDAIDALKACITPIFDVNEKHEAELLGSAVLIEASGETFLCTAMHVIVENENSTLYIDGPSQMEILQGDFYCSAEHDVAVLKLTPVQITLFQKYSALRDEYIANQTQASTSKYVEFVGFPETKNRKVCQQNKIKKLIQSIGCTVIEITPTKVRVSFKKKQNIDAVSRKRVTSPNPHGMSGGAMFGVPVNAATIAGRPHPRLVGITTDWPLSLNDVFGPSVAIVMAIIRDAWQIDLPIRLNPTNIKTHPLEHIRADHKSPSPCTNKSTPGRTTSLFGRQ